MNKWINGTLLTVIWAVTAAQADRILTSQEVSDLLPILTAHPRQTWLERGQVQVRHLEYSEMDKSVTETTELFMLDGEKFRWEINLEQRNPSPLGDSDAETPARRLPPVYEPDKKRIFAWDGTRHTRYFQTSGYALVSSGDQDMPVQVSGPLSAGVVPWGYGDFTLSNLLKMSPQASETGSGTDRRIILRLTKSSIQPALQISIQLNPLRNYAVDWYRWENELAVIHYTLLDYTYVGSVWMPKTVRIERKDLRGQEPKLLSYEDWKYDVITVDPPVEDAFETDLLDGTMVEMQVPDYPNTLLYHVHDQTNVSDLLADKLTLLSEPQPDRHNCATAAIRHLLKRYNRLEPNQEMTELVSEETRQTSLQEVKDTLEASGLYCLAVQTDLQTLKSLDQCSCLLHLPGNNHYVVLDHIDEQYIWTIDMTSRKFYWKTPIQDFLKQWKTGTVLLITESPIYLPGGLISMSTDQISQIRGGDFGTYSCSDIIQFKSFNPCPLPCGGVICQGSYQYFESRKGCIEDPSGGDCIGQGMLGYTFSKCTEDSSHPGQCTYEGAWYPRFIRACE